MTTDDTRKQLAEREARIARLEERGEDTTKQLAAARDECRRLADALADCQAELQAWATATYNDTPASLAESVAASVIEVVELRALNERLLADAKRLTAALQQVEAVREAGIREAVVAERDARAERLADALRATKVWLSSPRYFSVNYAVAEQERDDALVRIAAALADSPPAVEPRTITSEADAMVAVLREARQAMKRLKPSTHLGRPERHEIIGRIDAVLEAHHGKAEPPKPQQCIHYSTCESEWLERCAECPYAEQTKSPNAAAGGEHATEHPSGHAGETSSAALAKVVPAHPPAAEGSPPSTCWNQAPCLRSDCSPCVERFGCGREPAPEVTAAAREPTVFVCCICTAENVGRDAAFAHMQTHQQGAPQAAAQPVRDEDHVRKLEQFRSVVVQALEVLDG